MTFAIHTVNERAIWATPDRVYELAADVTAWPDILSHYRYVRVRSEENGNRTVEMGARRSGFPVRWTAVQQPRPEQCEIAYRHTEGITRGMDVLWRIELNAGRSLTTITHVLHPTAWWLRFKISRWVVGEVFVKAIAEKTLAGIAAHAEQTGQDR